MTQRQNPYTKVQEINNLVKSFHVYIINMNLDFLLDLW